MRIFRHQGLFSSVAIAFIVIFLPCLAFAQHAAGTAPWPERQWGGGVGFSLGTSTSFLNGTAHERVFEYVERGAGLPAARLKLSELEWDLKSLFFQSFQGTFMVMSRFRLNGEVWIAFNEGNGGMVDRDWLFTDTFLDQWANNQGLINDENWTDQSIHDNVPVESASMADINIEVRALSFGGVSLSGMAGYKRSYWEWLASGGTYIYSSSYATSPDPPRDLAGTFPDNESGIGYNQTYNIPYIGARLEAVTGIFHLSAYGEWSFWVRAEDEDLHYQRAGDGIVFSGEFSDGEYFGGGVAGTVNFETGRQLFSVALAVDYQHVSEIFGDMSLYYRQEGYFFSADQYADLQDSASVELSSTAVSLRFTWSFNSGSPDFY